MLLRLSPLLRGACRGKTSHRLPLLADMLQTAVNTSEARTLPKDSSLLPGSKLATGGKLAGAVPPSRGFRWACSPHRLQ